MNRNFLLTVTLSLSYFKEMTGDYETSLSLKCQSLHLQQQQQQQQRFISFLKEQYFKHWQPAVSIANQGGL